MQNHVAHTLQRIILDFDMPTVVNQDNVKVVPILGVRRSARFREVNLRIVDLISFQPIIQTNIRHGVMIELGAQVLLQFFASR